MKKKGFTLIELMVTVTIMMIMTAVVLFNYNKFNDTSLVSQSAYDLSLTIRQAQVYGVATRESGSGQGSVITTSSVNNFNFPYGISISAVPVTYPVILFVDVNGNGIYTTGSTPPEALQSYSLQGNLKIEEVCFSSSNVISGATGCRFGSGYDASALEITFKRPDPEANIVPVDSSLNPIGSGVSSAAIYLGNSDNSITRSVLVYPTGQISVQ